MCLIARNEILENAVIQPNSQALELPTVPNYSNNIILRLQELLNVITELIIDHLCGLVVRVLGYRSGVPGSIPGTTKRKKNCGAGTESTQPREYS
jgi:hypothetical protein